MLRRPGQALRHRRRPDGDDVDRRPGRRGSRAASGAGPRRRSESALGRLRGEIELPIPAASAVKIGGERAYRLARRGVDVEMPLRRSLVHALDVISYSGDAPRLVVRLALHVSSGTYVRAIAQALGGHCTTLRRTAVGPFAVDEAAPVEDATLLPAGDALERLPAEALATACRRRSAPACSRSTPATGGA